MNLHVLGVFVVGALCFLMGKDHSGKSWDWSDVDSGEIVLLSWAVVGCVFYLMDYVAYLK
ncbi:hypothetical protein JV59_37680 [Vibrio coralliilyticus]|nr:hypothetical protein JV59_37680 [Vibrio coralliilyticus]